MNNVPSLENYFQTNCQNIIPMLLKSIGRTLGQFVEGNFAGLAHVFAHWVKHNVL